MKSSSFEIKEIIICVNRQEVCIQGNAQQGVMHYPTSLYVNHSQLNRILGMLEQINSTSDLAESFESQADPEGNIFMFLNTGFLTKTIISMGLFENEKAIMKIRA
ncbi:MAG: hypothetical protein LW688_05325 [Cryomorphaceae bacterium]|nr:hypothetical protein [Cryomorphaceae bacterium]